MIIILTWNWKLLCAQPNCLFSLPLILSLQTKVKSGCHSHPHLRAQTSGLTRSDFPICNNDPTLSTLLMTKKKEKCSTKKKQEKWKKESTLFWDKASLRYNFVKILFFFPWELFSPKFHQNKLFKMIVIERNKCMVSH